MKPNQTAWSCVVDNVPAIWSSLIPWLATLFELVGVNASQVHVHHVCKLLPDIETLLKSLGVHTHEVERFHREHLYTNKIQQLKTDFTGSSHVVLTDVDLAFVARPPIENIQAAVAGKMVDGPHPRLEILRQIFSAAGLREPEVVTCYYWNREGGCESFETFFGNFNGGLYIIDPRHTKALGEAWSLWASWLIERKHLMGKATRHLDQVSFCLALADFAPNVELLPSTWNFPLHIPCYDQSIQPYVLHHHSAVDVDLCIQPGALAHAPESVIQVNAAIKRFLGKHTHGLPVLH